MCGQYLCVWVFHRVRTSLRVQSTDSLLACQWHYIVTAKRLLGNDEECLSLLAPADRERVRQKIRDESTSFRSFCLASMMWVNTLSFRFWMKKDQSITFRSLSFFRLHSSHSLTIRPHRIQVSSSRWDRLEDADELDTREEPLFLRDPLIERMDLESASSNLNATQ